jgi:hypothetical protein
MRPKPTGEGKFKCAKEAMIEAKVVPSMIGKIINNINTCGLNKLL